MKRKLFLLLCALLTMVGVQAQETPSNGNAYYIYNADYDLFFTRGGEWGTQAYASPVGIPWRVEITDGNYVLKMYDIYTQNTSADGGLGFNGSFTDNGSPIALTPSGDASNGFTLKNGDNYVTCPTTKGVVTMTSTASKWKFLTQGQYDAVLASRASAQEADVATSKGIVIPGGNTLNDVVSDVNAWVSATTADATPSKSTWPISGNAQRNGAYNEGGYGVEMFQTNNASITKTISGLAKGIYKVTVRGMKRMGTNEGSVAMKNAGFYVSDAYMEANGNIIPVKSWAADNTANNVPDGPNAVVTIINDNNGYTTEGFVYVGDDGNLELTLHNDAFWWGGWTVFNGVSYTFYNNEVSEADAEAILATANALLDQEMDATVKTNLTNAKNTFDGARTIANYNALQTAIDAAQASADAYALFAPERTKALALGMSADVIAALAPDVNALKVAEYNFVTTNYQYGVALGEWTSTGTNTSAATFNNEHWSGITHDYKNQNDANGQGWNASSWSINFSQNVTLPAGRYVFKVAGRQASGDQVTTSLVVKKGDDVLGTVNDFPRSNNSRGINKSGATAFEGDASAFANNGNGFGWEWRYVKFELADPATVNIAVNSVATAIHQWVSFGDYTLQTDDEDNVELMEALVNLNSAITTATLTKNTNVGTGVFQYDETTNETLWGVYSTAKSNAEAYEFTSSSTAEEVNALATALTTATTNYLNQPLNAPDAEKHYNIVVATTGHAKFGNAIVMDRLAEYPHYNGKYIDNNTGFTLSASAAPNANLAQACVFTPVAGKVNTYYISTERTEGTVYWTYGSLNDSKVNWNASQIQATTESSKKGEFKIAATATDNVFNIVNTTSVGGTIACQAVGSLYTEAGNADFTIAEASKASANLTVADGKMGTFVAPFDVELPENVKAYSAVSDQNQVTLTKIAEGGETLAAGTPVIVYGDGANVNQNWNQYGVLANNENPTVDALVGLLFSTNVPLGAYVLQTQASVQAFYRLGATATGILNRCYVTADDNSSARLVISFDEEDPTAINVIEAAEAETGALKDGKYLIGNKIVLVKNGVKYGANGQILK